MHFNRRFASLKTWFGEFDLRHGHIGRRTVRRTECNRKKRNAALAEFDGLLDGRFAVVVLPIGKDDDAE